MPAAAAKPRTRTERTARVSLSRVRRVILYVSDFDRAVRFYTRTLGVPVKSRSAGWAELATEGVELDLHGGRKSPHGGEGPIVIFQVRDFDATYAALKGAGIKVGKIFSPCGGIRCAAFTDLDGNPLEIEGK